MSFLALILLLRRSFFPTRVTEHSKTLIDNILCSPTESGTISGNIIYAISDHLPQFCLFPTLDLGRARTDGLHYQKARSKFNAIGFLTDLQKNTIFGGMTLTMTNVSTSLMTKSKFLLIHIYPQLNLPNINCN